MPEIPLSKVSRGENNMPSHTDIKPVISSPSTHTPCPPPRSDCDIKPNPSEVADVKPSRDFRRERQALKRQYDLEKRNLDLEEENRLLREARPAMKVEHGLGDVKPDITRLSGGSGSGTIDLSLIEESDDDDVVFVREVKPGRPKRLHVDETTAASQDFAEPSISRVKHPSNLDREPACTPNIVDRRLGSRRLPTFPAKRDERGSTSTRHSRKPSISRGKVPRRDSSEVSYGSSVPESDTDDFDDTYTGRFSTPDWARTRKRAVRRRRDDITTSKRGSSRARTEAVERSRELDSAGTAEIDQMSGNDDHEEEEVDDSSSGDDEYTGPYKGPHLHVISVEWINNRLDSSFHKYRMSLEYLGQWAAWWPRTKVAKYHRLDSAGIWLLTVAVHKWWSDLLEELNSPHVEWPEGLDEIGQEDITMKVEEITLSKESAMVAAKRIMLKDGEEIPVDSVLYLRHGTRRRS